MAQRRRRPPLRESYLWAMMSPTTEASGLAGVISLDYHVPSSSSLVKVSTSMNFLLHWLYLWKSIEHWWNLATPRTPRCTGKGASFGQIFIFIFLASKKPVMQRSLQRLLPLQKKSSGSRHSAGILRFESLRRFGNQKEGKWLPICGTL